MTLEEFKNELRLVNDGDVWGTVMGAFFDIAAVLNTRPLTPVPDEWDYRPGLGGGIEEDSYWHELLVSTGDRELVEIGNYCHHATDVLRKLGKDY